MTDQRPELNRNISLKDFNDFYWLKEELAAFCRQHGISTAGGKPELAERIAVYLQTGETVKPLPKDKATSRFDWNSETLTPETLITDSYRNTENVRAFFAKEIGAHFRFNVVFCRWMKQNAGKRLNDAIVEWNRISALKKDKSFESEIGAQFEYNTYIRDFLKDNPELSFRDARKYWMLKKQTRGSNKYTKDDLLLSGKQPQELKQNKTKMVRYVNKEDVPGCLSLMEVVKDDFAGYRETEFLEALHKAIEHKEAILVEEDGVVAGLLSFSYAGKELIFLATRPEYRKKGIAKALIEKMKNCFTKGDTIHVITFRDGDMKGTAARACYHSCGFTGAEEMIVFDYSCQKLVCMV